MCTQYTHNKQYGNADGGENGKRTNALSVIYVCINEMGLSKVDDELECIAEVYINLS